MMPDRMMVVLSNRGVWPWTIKIRSSTQGKNTSLGTKESLREPNRHCGQSMSGRLGASFKQRDERAILRCSIWPSIANFALAMWSR